MTDAAESEPKLTGAPERIIGGMTFRCYSVGIMRTEWRTDGGLIRIGARSGAGYWAEVGGQMLSTRFRSMESAAKAAVRASGYRP